MSQIDPRVLRDILGEYPTGVTIVTAYDPEANPVGMTVNSFASVSLDPPLILWSIDKNAGMHEVFTQANNFCVHFLSRHQEDLSNRFAGVHEDRFNGINWKKGELDAPLLKDANCRIHCELEDVYAGGDHNIILGKVLKLDSGENHCPLLFHKGRYKTL